MMTFDADLSHLAGEHVMLEYAAEEHMGGGASAGDWFDPKFLLK